MKPHNKTFLRLYNIGYHKKKKKHGSMHIYPGLSVFRYITFLSSLFTKNRKTNYGFFM